MITLAIIGIVAALTIPTLVKNYQMKLYEVAFKKEYASIQNALNYLTIEENIGSCHFDKLVPTTTSDGSGITYRYSFITSGCKSVYDGLISKLKLSPLNDNYYLNYTKQADVLSNGGSTINSSYNHDKFFQYADAYISPDGTVIFLIDKSTMFYSTSLVIDINGAKGPNKWGYDVFYMTLVKHSSGNNLILTDQYASIIEKGGKLPRTILRNQKENTSFSWTWE